MGQNLITIDYPDGNRIATRFTPWADLDLTDEQRAAVVAAFDALDLSRHDRELMLLILVEEIHEEAIYRKVAERRGVLAL